MAFALPTDFSRPDCETNGLFFWIRPIDDRGFAVDTIFAEAAYSKAQELRLYRWRELTDEAVRADLVERAVYAASRAQTESPVHDPKGYILTTFTRLVDHYISRENALWQTAEPKEEEIRQEDSYAKSGADSLVSFDHLDDAILRSQILNAMSPEDRWAWKRRLIGYEVQEIAAELRISANCLSTRMVRCAKEAARVLMRRRARK